MTVKELNRDQIDALKWDYFYSDNYDEKITNAAGRPVLFAGDIPDNVIFAVYAGIDFVNEDFICSMEEKTNENNKKAKLMELYEVLEALENCFDDRAADEEIERQIEEIEEIKKQIKKLKSE